MSCVEDWLLEHIPSGNGIAIDVGANVGNWTKYLALRFQHVVSVEPDPQAIVERAANCADVPNAWLVNAAIGSAAGTLTLHQYEQTVWTSCFADRTTCGRHCGTFDVRSISLDDLYSAIQVLRPEWVVQFVKIDTEGAELAALAGASRLLREQHPKLIVEVHSETLGKHCRDVLLSHGYVLRDVIHPWETAGSAYSTQHFWYIADYVKQVSPIVGDTQQVPGVTNG